MTSRLQYQIIAKTDPDQPLVPDYLRQSMFDLYFQYYAGTSATLFNSDLKQKDYVILLWNESHQLQGFSTVQLINFEFNHQPIRAIFSGDTIIHNDYWGEQTLPLAWCRLSGKIKAENTELPLYWFLIVKGYRTYRYLPIFSHKFYPTHRYPTPPEIQSLMDYLANFKFGDYYDPQTGLVKFPESQGHLRDDWADVKEGFRDKPDIKYFLERNPEYYKGHELVCFTELSEENMRSHARRGFIEGLQGKL